MLPRWRTERYAIWSACERFGILPPDVKNQWDAMDAWTQGSLLAYSQVRQYEEAEERAKWPSSPV